MTKVAHTFEFEFQKQIQIEYKIENTGLEVQLSSTEKKDALHV